MQDGIEIALGQGWIEADLLERQLMRSGYSQKRGPTTTTVTFHNGCKVRVDAAARLLSFLNQADESGESLVLDFRDGQQGVMGYLDRLGFFGLLSQSIQVKPILSSSTFVYPHTRLNSSIVEFQAISPYDSDQDLPTILTNSIEAACSARPDHVKLGRAAYTIFGELIDNVYQHSETSLDGFAGMQVYPRGGKALVVVSDSGVGLLNTLRPALDAKKRRLNDIQLLIELFNHGLSRYGSKRGCGLQQSAVHALKYQAELTIRLRNCSIRLVPASDGYTSATAYCIDGLVSLEGTHISFGFNLDKQQ